MKTHQRSVFAGLFPRSRLNRMITLACMGAGALMMSGGSHATTYELSTGEDKTIGSDSTITVANDDGVVAYNVVAGDLVIESDGGIDASADTQGSYGIAGVRILGAGENAGAGDMINRGLMASVIADETGGWIDALGLNVESDAFGAGSAVVRVNTTTNEGIIRADAGVGNIDAYVSGVDFLGVVEDNATGSATLLAGDMKNSVGATIGASGGMWAHGFALGAKTDGAGDATTGVDDILNQGDVTVADGSAHSIGLSLSSVAGSTGDAAVSTVDLTNQGKVTVTVASTVTPNPEGLDAMGIFLDSLAMDAGDASAGITGTAINSGTINVTIDGAGAGYLYYAGGAVFRAGAEGDGGATTTADFVNETDAAITVDGGAGEGVGIGVHATTGDWQGPSTGTGNAVVDIGTLINRGSIDAGGDEYAIGIDVAGDSLGMGDAIIRLDEITNDGAITVVDASEEAIGIGFSGNTEAGGNTAITVASLVNGSDGVITVSGAAYTAGIDFHSRTSDDGDAAITVDSVLNQGNIIARDGTVDTTGIAFFSSASDTGNATITITGDVTNEAGGEIVSSGHGISLSTSEDGSGSATISVGGGLVNAGTIQSETDGYGIYIGAGVTIADGIINRGVIQGADATPYAIYIEDDAGSGAPAIAVSGDDARLVGAVHAINSTLTVTGQSDDGYFATEGAFELLGLAIAADGALEIADGAHTITVGNGGFINRGDLRVPTEITAAINGDYSQAGDGVYVVQLDVSGQTPTHGTLAVDGDVDLDNRLSVTMSDAVRTFLEESGDETEIGEVLTYTGSATNSDAIIVMSDDLLMEFTAEDDGNGIHLSAAPIDSYAEALRSEGAVGGAGDDVSGIALALGTVLDDAKRTGGLSQDMKAVVAKLQTLTPKERGKAMKEIKETSTAVAVNSVAAKVGGGFSGAMQNRVAAMTAPDGFSGVGTGLAAGDFGIDRVWWLKPYGSVGEQNDKNGVPGYDMDSRGLAFGFDQDLSPAWRAGVAVSYTNTNVDSNAGNQNVDIDTYQIGVYGTRELDEDNRLNVQAGIGRGRYDSRRVIPSLGGVTEASYDSTNFMGSAALERDFVRSTNALLRASVSAEYAYVNMDGYSENGAGVLDLEIAGSDQDSLILGLGGEYQHANAGQGIFSINAFAGYDALADQSSVSTQLAAGGPAFTTEGMDPERFLFRGGLGYEFRNGDNVIIETRYDTELRKGFDDHAFSVKLKYSF